ncbi:MAG: class I adenylate-forming enzyme family protein [Candidatus Jordarchaeaceae archaeon]
MVERIMWRFLERNAKEYPDLEAYRYLGRSETYEQVDEKSDILAKHLIRMGVKKGDRISAYIPPVPEFLLFFMATSKLGAILTPLDTRFKSTELTYTNDIAQPNVFIYQPFLQSTQTNFEEQVKEMLPQFQKNVKHYISLGETKIPKAVTMQSLLKDPLHELDGELEKRKKAAREEDPILIIFTTGTTGPPKATLLTHKSISSMCLNEVKATKASPEDRVLCHFTPSHVAGSCEIVSTAIVGPLTTVFLDHFNPKTTLDTVQNEKVTMWGQIPTMFQLEFVLPNFNDYDFSSVRLCIIAGEPPTKELVQRLQKIGQGHVITGWGLTETSGFATWTEIDDTFDNLSNTVGKAAGDYKIKIVDIDNPKKELKTGEIGEIAVIGDCNMAGYFGNPEETKKTLLEGNMLLTGDVGYLREDGYLVLTARKKEIIRYAAYNIYPPEVEDYITKYPGIIQAAVVGVPDPIYTEVPWAIVRPNPWVEKKVTAEELIEYCKKGLADYKVPRRIIFKDNLPLTRVAKIDKKALKAEAIEIAKKEGKIK